MPNRVPDARHGSAYVFLVAREVADDVVVVNRRPVKNQDWCSNDNYYAGGKTQIVETSPHSAGKIGVSTPQKPDGNTYSGKSGTNAHQVNDSQETVQYQEAADQSTPERPTAIEEKLRPDYRACPDAIKAIGGEIHSEIEQSTPGEPCCGLA